uniref:Uncharacterized protein n=1 Tax=Ciona savignyi TaxID=51511 RepID=H2Y8M6_CIOSA
MLNLVYPFVGMTFRIFNCWTILLTMFVILMLLIINKNPKKTVGAPPGPKGYPVLGVLPYLMKFPERKMAEWSSQHGSIIMVKIGLTDVVVLGSSSAAHAAFVKNTHLSDRPQDGLEIFAGGKGLLFINASDFHTEQRRFCLSALREFGMGKKTLEPKILDCAAMLCDHIISVCGNYDSTGPIQIEELVYITMSSVISHLVFGHDTLQENDDLRRLLLRTVEPNKFNALAGVLMFIPSLKNIPPFSITTSRAVQFREGLHHHIRIEIDRHRASRDPNQPRDLIDNVITFLCSKSRRKNVGSFTEEQLVPLVRDLFMAGTDTSSTTITWAILFLASFPDVQGRIHEEIDTIIEYNQRPSISFEDKMPYVRAVLQETFRLRPPLPLSVPHVAHCNTSLMGYRIPKGAIILTNTWGIQNNPKLWPEPEKFKPERHIDEFGKFIKSPDVIPFNIGTRHCLGQQLAKMELFITLTSLCQRFRFTLPLGETPDLTGESTFILRPFPFHVIATKRH